MTGLKFDCFSWLVLQGASGITGVKELIGFRNARCRGGGLCNSRRLEIS
jgi:hypothetical protein